MLKQISIANLKCIDEANLKLAPLTILTGTNSSGKSTVLQALMLIIKHSHIKNHYSMEELVRYLNDFASIRNKKNNAMIIDVSVVDIIGKDCSLQLRRQEFVIFGGLPYLYEREPQEPGAELFYLNANRIGAQEYVQVSERKVGNLGEHLFSTFDRIKGNTLDANLLRFEDSKTILFQVSEWLGFITDSEAELITEKSGDRVNVSFTVKDLDSNISPFNLGAGMSYIAKVIIICLMGKPGDLVLLENPEIQLHPQAQARLGEFLAFVANSGIQLVVETHCEHLINGVLHEIYEDNLSSDDLVIHYKRSVDSSFETILADDNGEFNDINGNIIGFPKGFFDATLDKLMMMR